MDVAFIEVDADLRDVEAMRLARSVGHMRDVIAVHAHYDAGPGFLVVFMHRICPHEIIGTLDALRGFAGVARAVRVPTPRASVFETLADYAELREALVAQLIQVIEGMPADVETPVEMMMFYRVREMLLDTLRWPVKV
ncbi:MAG: hypothetical protein WCI67_06960 [Chloroflexales bacterium]